VTTQAAPGDGDGRRTVAVLGGTGFVGRAFCARFAERGWRVLAVSRTAHTAAQSPGVEFRPLDLTRTGAPELTALLAGERVDAVLNAAGGMWGLTEEQMLAVNVALVRTLVEAIAAAPGRPRLLQMGSVHEYGMVPVGTSITEEHPAAPVTAYGRLKLEAGQIILDAAQRGDIEAVVLRYGNVTGPGQPSHSLLGIIADKLAAASRAGVAAQLTLDPLTALRDYVDLHDCADAAALILESDASGMVVNVARGAATVTRELVDALIAISGVPAQVTESAAEAKPETEWQQLDVSRAERLFGWTARRELKDSLAELWRAHPGK
jgi:nucleoside-diphosphate-sugar epimerase